MKVRSFVQGPEVAVGGRGVNVGAGAETAEMGVKVASGSVGWGCVGGRNGVGVAAGEQPVARKIPANRMLHERRRNIFLLNHKVTGKIHVTLWWLILLVIGEPWSIALGVFSQGFDTDVINAKSVKKL
jgi:hypothetical protein